MSKQEKILKRICETPVRSDIKWDELKSCLQHMGFKLLEGGKTGGSRRKFLHTPKDILIICHQPHPSPDVDKGCVADVAEKLKENGFINEE